MARLKNETKEQYNARMNEYMKAKYKRVRAEHVERMGGKCVDCGASDGLEFDHKDQASKEFNVAHIMLHNKSKVLAELDKCVLRCVACHAHITAYQRLQGTNLLHMGV